MPDERPTSDFSQQRRWILPFVLHVSVFVAFIDRINLSLALPELAEYYGWSERETGDRGSVLMGAFFLAYAISNICLSGMAAKWGLRKSLIALVIAFSVFTALGAPLSFSLPLFVVTRILLGLGEGVHFPVMSGLMKNWFPLHERSRANAIWIFGGNLAIVLAPVLLVPIVDRLGWQAMLVVCGTLGMLVTLPLLSRFAFDTPREAPFMERQEVEYIEANVEESVANSADWNFLRWPVFWLAALGAIANNFCIWAILSWLPTYFVKARGLDFSDLNFAASLPYVAGFLGFTLSALLGDHTNRRIAIAALGFFGASASVLCVTYAASIPLTIAAFSAGTFFQSAYVSQEYAIVQRILPANIIGQAAGIYTGLSVLFGALGGTVLLGQIVSFTGSFDLGLYSVVAVAALGACIMAILSRLVRY